ncbi:MAG: Ig-like domain-containing protein, partial [Spirochaetota bacterium]|nr:Ig-like domain-containing protein [Spirochaetota bacterium]
MKLWKNQYTVKIFIGIVVLFMVGCPNNLVDKIEEEVEVVVTPPSVVSIYPEAGAVSIPIDVDNILITFTKKIDSSSVNNSTFITKDSDGNTISGTYSVSNDTISFNPSSDLLYSATYTITAKSAILDMDGNQMSDEFSWSFTTVLTPEEIKPVLQSVLVNDGYSATNVPTVTLKITGTDSNGSSQGLRSHYR